MTETRARLKVLRNSLGEPLAAVLGNVLILRSRVDRKRESECRLCAECRARLVDTFTQKGVDLD